jgi:predicted lipid-binding transport protein (Tim44 family)
MKFQIMTWVTAVLVAVGSLGFSGVAEAKRLGGGKSIGKQQNTTQRDATPASPGGAAAAPAAAGAAGAAAQAARKPWGGILGGLALGLGAAALFSYLGMGGQMAEMFGSFLMIALLLGAGFFIWRMLRKPKAEPAMAGAPGNAQFRAFNPDNTYTGGIGGEAMTQRFDATAAKPPGVPADFDVAGFVETAKKHYVRLQQSWDAGDLTALKQFCDDAVFAELKGQIEARGGVDKTDVVTLDAKLLGIEQSAGQNIASVEFTGLVREETFGGASPFREVWNLSKPVAGAGGWLLVGIEQLTA